MAKAKLDQTKGKFKLLSRVKGIGNENSVREGYTNSDKEYKSLAFFGVTSAINQIKVEMFGMERDQVTAYSNKDKKSKKINWADRHKSHGEYKVMGITCFLEPDPNDSSKKLRKVLVEYDAVSYIKEHLKDDDVVRITGELDFQEYTNSQGKTVNTVKFIIKTITKVDEVLDFGSPDFKEEAKFEHNIVISDVMLDDDVKRLFVSAKIIKYGGDIADTSFVVDSEEYPKLAANMVKRFGFGDLIKVYGNLINSVTIKESDEPEQVVIEDEDDWGGDEDIKGDFDSGNYMREYVQELRIISVDSTTFEPKKYTEDDLLSEDDDAFKGKIKDNSASKNADTEDDADDDDVLEDEDDDLPFE